MKDKEKQLLLKDICGRLSYGLKGKCEIDASYDTSFDTIYQLHKFDAILEGIKEDLLFVTPLIENKDEQEFANEEVADGIDILDFKPYLRPMSSMTDKEEENFNEFIVIVDDIWKGDLKIGFPKQSIIMSEGIDYLNSIHIDYRGLIEKGLAIKVTEENNPYKE